MNYSPIEKAVQTRLNNVATELTNSGKSNTVWTERIKKELAILAESYGYSQSSNYPPENKPEWLFDISWYKLDSTSRNLLEFPLALESEWSWHFKDIQYDFQKLLVAKADTRVMIFQGDDKTVPEILEKLKDDIKAFRHTSPGDRYMFAPYVNGCDKFQYDLFIA